MTLGFHTGGTGSSGAANDFKASARGATTAALAANTYANGSSGVGATLTANANGSINPIDGLTLVAGDRLLVKNEVASLGNGIYCLDEETEILTKEGFKKYTEIKIDDSVLTFSLDLGGNEWEPIKAINVFDVKNEEMLFMGNSKGHYSLSTLNHRWPVKHRSYDKHIIVESKDLNYSHSILRSAPLLKYPESSRHSDEFVELVAWFFTEGHLRKNNSGTLSTVVRIVQSAKVNPLYVERIRHLLIKVFGKPTDEMKRKREGVWEQEWNERPNSNGHGLTTFELNSIAGKALVEVAPDRIVSYEFLKELTKEQLHIFVDTAIKADGHIRKNGQITFGQNKIERVEPFQFACTLLGLATTLKAPFEEGQYTVYVGTRNTCQSHLYGNRTHYTGKVWCPTTGNGTWIARRNGCVFITGNTVTQVGTAGTPYILTRASDANSSDNISSGMIVTVSEGTVNADLAYILTSNDPITVGTTALTFAQFGAGSAIGSAVSGGTTGSVLFIGAATVLAQDNANFFWDDTNNFLGIGTASPASELHTVSISTSNPRGVIQDQYTTDALGARYNLRKARGTPTVPTTVVTADAIGRIVGWGYDGANFLQMAQISMNAVGTIAATRVPTTISFSTATDAAPSVLTTAMTIDQNQRLGLGTTTPSVLLDVVGGAENITRTGLTTTSTDGLLLINTTAALVGTTAQWSPRLHFSGTAWKSSATAASQVCDGIIELQPSTGTSGTNSNLVFSVQTNAGGYIAPLTLQASFDSRIKTIITSGSGTGVYHIIHAQGGNGISSTLYTLSAAVTAPVAATGAWSSGGGKGLYMAPDSTSRLVRVFDYTYMSGVAGENSGVNTGFADTSSTAAVRIYGSNPFSTMSPTLYTDITHNATNGVISTGSGALLLNPASSIVGLMGATSSFPALKRSSAALHIRLADDSAFAVLQAAGITSNGLLTSTTDIVTSAAGAHYWQGRAAMYSPADGIIELVNAASSDFSRLQFGGTTSSFPALKRSTTTLLTRLADDSAPAVLRSSVLVSAKATTPITVSVDDVETNFTNEGATAQIVFNLPTAAAGYEYTFIVQDADGIQVVANTGDTIRIGSAVSASAGNAASTTIGSTLTLRSINLVEWVATAMNGTWVIT